MKIAQIVCAYPPYAGGIGNSAKQIYETLNKNHEVVNFTPENTRPLLKRGHGAFIPQLLWKLKDFDYIYLHYPFFGTAEIIWLYKLINKNKKLIIHYHMDVENKSIKNKILSWPSLLIRKKLLKQADTIVTGSLDYIKNSKIKKYYQNHPEKFKEIPFAINTDEFKPKEINLPSENKIAAKTKDLIKKVNKLFIKKDRLDLIFIGGLDKQHYFKGIPVLLQALFNLNNKNWRLKIIGSGDMKIEYENMATRLGILNQIDFTGKLEKPDLIRSLQNSDILVLPSINRNEAFGIVLIEALACGVPVIASNLPGVRKVFTDREEGLLINPNDEKDLEEKIKFLLKNENIREVMAKKARILAKEKYSLETMEKYYENLFNK